MKFLLVVVFLIQQLYSSREQLVLDLLLIYETFYFNDFLPSVTVGEQLADGLFSTDNGYWISGGTLN